MNAKGKKKRAVQLEKDSDEMNKDREKKGPEAVKTNYTCGDGGCSRQHPELHRQHVRAGQI